MRPADAHRHMEAEADGYIEALAGELDEAGRRLVVRNGHALPPTSLHHTRMPEGQLKNRQLLQASFPPGRNVALTVPAEHDGDVGWFRTDGVGGHPRPAARLSVAGRASAVRATAPDQLARLVA